MTLAMKDSISALVFWGAQYALGSEAAASATSLPWSQILDYSEKGAKIVAIIAAGIVGYYKFLRGRVFRPRLEIEVSSSLLLVGNRQYIKVAGIIKNTGASRIDFDLANSALRVFAAPERVGEIADSINWEQIGILDLGGRHSWIEPAETVCENWLITLPVTASNPAFRSELRVAGKKTAWYADAIVERQPVLLSAPPKSNNPAGEKETRDGRPQRPDTQRSRGE